MNPEIYYFLVQTGMAIAIITPSPCTESIIIKLQERFKIEHVESPLSNGKL